MVRDLGVAKVWGHHGEGILRWFTQHTCGSLEAVEVGRLEGDVSCKCLAACFSSVLGHCRVIWRRERCMGAADSRDPSFDPMKKGRPRQI
jgi:hypothetical protein